MAEPAPVLDALGDANRRAILEILARGAFPVGQIAERLPIITIRPHSAIRRWGMAARAA